MFDELTEFLDNYLEMGVPGYDCIIMQHGKCVYRHSNGFSDIKEKTPVVGNELYNIYSCTKIITCVAAMQLWEQGAFSLEDKLSEYMPELSEMTVRTESGIKKAKNPILIKHLFEMTSGFNMNGAVPSIKKFKADTNGKCPTRLFPEYLALEPLDFEPGTRWQYGYSHAVLAALIEVITNKRFGVYVKENIFDVLGMENSTFSLPDSELQKISPQYVFNGADNPPTRTDNKIIFKLGSEFESGGGGCISTVDDFIKLLEALREGEQLLKRDTVRLMTTDRLNSTQTNDYWFKESHGYGLGLRCPKKGGSRFDFGWGGAAGAYACVDTKYDATFFYVQHILNPPNAHLRVQMYDAAAKGFK